MNTGELNDELHIHKLENADRKQVRLTWPYIVIVLGLAISILTGLFVYNYYKGKEDVRLELASNEIVTLVKSRMSGYEQVLKSGVGLFNASESVSREEWAIFVKEHKLDENFKGIQGLGYSEIVLPQNRQQH